MISVTDKVALITGGARGMGAATCRRFAADGARVIVADVAEEEGRALAQDIGASFQKLNVAAEADWERAIGAVLQQHGRIDALVNNAGVIHFSDIDNMEEREFDRVLAINLKGPLFGIKHAGRAMKAARKGAIVNVSSIDAFRGPNALGAYVSSKWAVRGLTKTAAMEYGHKGVRVNSVHPGGVDTTMGNPLQKTGAERDADYANVPLQRIGLPDEIAAASLFLCSDAASYINGAELLVDGGWNAGIYHAFLAGSPTFQP